MNDSLQAEKIGDSTQRSVRDSAGLWFLRGTSVGLLLMAAVNALSYFVRSSDWSGLVSQPKPFAESLGFPLVIWESGNTYEGMFVDYPNLGFNFLFAAAVGSLIGWWTSRRRDRLNELIEEMQNRAIGHLHQPIQFSLKGLMVATAIFAFVVTLAKSYAARPETLIAIYALGPLMLVAIAMLPRRLNWQKRVMIIIPATLALIIVAIVVGVALGMEFDKVMMGIFLFWTPQSVLAAVGLTSWTLLAQSKSRVAEPPPMTSE